MEKPRADPVEEVYLEIRRLVEGKASEVRISQAFDKLREVQRREAVEIRKRLEASLTIPLDFDDETERLAKYLLDDLDPTASD